MEALTYAHDRGEPGGLPSIRLGASGSKRPLRRYRPEDVAAFIERRLVEASPS